MQQRQNRHHGKTAAQGQDGDATSPLRSGMLAPQCLALSIENRKKGKDYRRRPPPGTYPNRGAEMRQTVPRWPLRKAENLLGVHPGGRLYHLDGYIT